MISHSVGELPLSTPQPAWQPVSKRIRGAVLRLGAGLLGRLLGAADSHTVASVANRELSLILRSGEWHRFLGMWLIFSVGVLLIPMIYRAQVGNWRVPDDRTWSLIGGYTLQAAAFFAMAQFSVRRLRRDLYSNRLDELMMTRCSPADLAMGEALASAVASLWLVWAALPTCLFLSALSGQGMLSAIRLTLSLAPAAGLGVWFGMGWGLAFTLRPSAVVPLTQWWVLGPLLPIWIAWSGLGCFTLALAVLGFFPGGTQLLGWVLLALHWVLRQVIQHWNPFFAVGGALQAWNTTWLTDWAALIFVLLFMMRKSMDAVQMALATLPESQRRRPDMDPWFHHDGHYFRQYWEGKRNDPKYRDGSNAIAAFDTALGHRVYLHPFLWTVAWLGYLFMLGWSLLVPNLGLYTGVAAVLIPATGALLLMSGGVAVSFGWERDQHRWPALAVLPIRDFLLAWGKINGVVRPTLWVGLTASLTALLLGWRGALPWESSLWMALHVLVFPVVLAVVSAVLSLTTPDLAEALFRWATYGAIPTLAYLLPPPVGGDSGLALPFTPPLLALLLVVKGPTPELIHASYVSVAVQAIGMAGALVILTLFVRRWTVGERD